MYFRYLHPHSHSPLYLLQPVSGADVLTNILDAVLVRHAFAQVANEYAKRSHVFTLTLITGASYLIQAEYVWYRVVVGPLL